MNSQHQVNVNRRIRTQEYAMNMNPRDGIKDPSFSYRSDMFTSSLYCACRDCVKFCCYNKPLKFIDPYLIDMRYTHWIYHGLVAASKTASTRNQPEPENTRDGKVEKKNVVSAGRK